jgi:two-component system, chemotaxis family, sensor kinase CheA
MAYVLVVDDDADIRASMRTLLEDIGGHTVLEANDGLSALDALRSSEHRLVVLLDLLMPAMDGISVLQAVAADESLASRHAFVLVTVSRRAMTKEFPASLAIAVPVLPKPFDMDSLLAMVDQSAQQIGGG